MAVTGIVIFLGVLRTHCQRRLTLEVNQFILY